MVSPEHFKTDADGVGSVCVCMGMCVHVCVLYTSLCARLHVLVYIFECLYALMCVQGQEGPKVRPDY